VPVHELAATEHILRVLDGHPAKCPPGERFSYCNSGDGGVYSTAADIQAMLAALFVGRIVSTEWVAELVRPRSDVPAESMRYGLGFWLHQSREAVILEGYDAGVSFRSVHDPVGTVTHTMLSNTSDGAWPITRHLDRLLTP
jgi:CubicO group peptidase (beta-lactamase class C family)